MKCPKCKASVEAVTLGPHVESEHPAEVARIRAGPSQFEVPGLVVCSYCPSLTFVKSGAWPSHFKSVHPHEVEKNRAFNLGMMLALALGLVFFGGTGMIVGAQIHASLYPFGGTYAKMPDCPGSHLRSLSKDYSPDDADEAARAARFHNWTGVRIEDLGHYREIDDGTGYREKAPLLTVTGFCPAEDRPTKTR